MQYRPVPGDEDEFSERLDEITLPYKKLREMRPDEKARLTKTSSMMLPATWSAGEGSASLQIWSKSQKLSKGQLETITNRTPVYYGYACSSFSARNVPHRWLHHQLLLLLAQLAA
jgi:hypothetical protein